jgi:lysophospholipase L1-like esterase
MYSHFRRPVAFIAAIIVATTTTFAQTRPATTRASGLARWEKAIAAYEAADRANPPAKGGVLFIGASSIRLWKTLEQDFPDHHVINRGFGGSQIADSTHFAERIIFPYAPKMVVLRAGGNDLHAGKSVEQVFDDFKAFVAKVRTKLPDAEIVYVSMSPAPARWDEREANRELNRRIEQYAREQPKLKYVETYDMTLTPDGQAREELFVADKLHFNEAGYKLLAERVRPVLPPATTRPATTTAAAHDFQKWEKEISAFEEADRNNPPAKGGIVFIGSSTIRGWRTLASDYPEHHVINRGFGGSQIVDATHFADRIVIPYAPKMVFLRAGGNDIHAGKSAEQVFQDFKDFVATIHRKLPDTEVVFIGLAPAPVRWDERDANKALNALVERFAKEHPRVGYVDTYDTTVTPDGQPREELFVKDRLHFNAEGYKLLAERVRPMLPKP